MFKYLLRLPIAQMTKIKKIAKAEFKSVNNIIRLAIEQYLEGKK